MLTEKNRIAILMHEGILGMFGKTGLVMLRHSPYPIVAVIDKQCAGGSIPQLTGIQRDVPVVASLQDAIAYHPDTLLIGIAPPGGVMPAEWWSEVQQAVQAGMNVVNGLHRPMATDPELQPFVKKGQWIWDVRVPPADLPVGSGKARTLPCKRVLTVGTDMAVGKMTASWQMHQVCLARGMKSKFIASGQTGIMLDGDGMPLDGVRVDFATGAMEMIVMKYGTTHDILHIEGQGSLFNPASTATLPLLRGTQPTHLIVVHRAGQTHCRRYSDVPIPPLKEVVKIYEMLASSGGSFEPAKVVGIALNTGHMDDAAARKAIRQAERETKLPCTDPIRFSAEVLVDATMV